ncbi:MAG: FAD-binding protein [Candidatus Diapherotrites archaeon]|nr:FAD-binding protein [Candidatus Diapherotrites archaeon]
MDADVIVVGAGLAGLMAALHAKGDVLIVSSGQPNTEKAQGGIAASLGKDDSEELHFRDTINAGDGLCEEEAVNILIKDGKERVKELRASGLKFDDEPSMEAAHSVRRVLHIGDFTGMEVLSFVNELARDIPRLDARVKGLLISQGRCCGVVTEKDDELNELRAGSVILATGGYAGLYSKTTNPESAVGAGALLAYQAGAELMDLELVQFHPTVFDGFLISEAIRGEGAELVNDKGERFLKRHNQDELSGRDVVARAVQAELQAGRKVFLDATSIEPGYFKKRFSHIYSKCVEMGIDPTKRLVPVEPAAHYCMGGVRTDLNARTNIPGLLACGEVACTGVHGANRLASNSLLEALVFGARAGEQTSASTGFTLPRPKTCIADVRPSHEAKQVLWDSCGISRSEKSLKQGLAGRPGKLAELIIRSALARKESRGAHYREDFPAKWKVPMHTVVRRNFSEVRFVRANT